ncbi:MAG: hypothetical protein Kow00108_27180 [Calditrichia bacterium]
MNSDFIQEELKAISPEIQCHYFEKIDSTNSYAYFLGQNNHPNWSIVIAEEQEKGKGRLDRKWESKSGKGLWFSILLRKSIEPRKIQAVSLIFGELIRESIQTHLREKYGIQNLSINTKWPNDIYVNQKKMCGILLQGAITNNLYNFIVGGIGINVNHQSSDFSEEVKNIATSLYLETGKIINREELLIHIIQHIYSRWPQHEDNLKEILDEWKNHALFIGKKIQINHYDKIIEGVFKDINEYGHLILEQNHGSVQILTGDLMNGDSK